MRTRIVVALLALCMGCGGGAVSAFAKDRAAAERSYAAGRYQEAARHWHAAAVHAKTPGWARKAKHRQAMSLLRGGDWQPARTVLIQLAEEKSPLASRARYDLALLELEHGQAAAGTARLRQVIIDDPESSVAGIALRRHLSLIEEQQGAAAVLAEISTLLSTLSNTSLDEPLRFEQASQLVATSQLEPALHAYLDLAERHPYPRGAHWDDALWHAAGIEEQLGRPQRAIAHLEHLLSVRESSDFVGSYERPRYGQARFHLAELIRDQLHDPARAREEFWRLFKRHPNSLLRDDALWEAAKLARTQGDSAGTCSLLRTLREALAQSRYVACAPLLCADLANNNTQARCAPYIASTLAVPASSAPSP
ncbi:MAG TPA: tetratricopeptide repeat protein [Polyangiaceae bacterium]|nr:tetratricopeptide repeat protein [Polyangiaceae bacterium]